MVDTLINFVHLVAAIIWIGGAFYILFILQPALRSTDPQYSGKLQGILAHRFSWTAGTCVVLLLITGFLRTPGSMLFDPSSDFGRVLLIKHLLIAASLLVGLSFNFYVIPALRKLAPKPGEVPSAEFISMQKKLGALGLINLLLGFLIVLCATLLR